MEADESTLPVFTMEDGSISFLLSMSHIRMKLLPGECYSKRRYECIWGDIPMEKYRFLYMNALTDLFSEV